MRNLHSTVLIVCSLAIVALAPNRAAAQSPFALRNLGQRLAVGDARMQGRGGWGMAVADSLLPGFLNPASPATVRHVVFRITGYGETADSESPLFARTSRQVITPAIRVAVPVDKGRLALTAGFQLERSSRWSTEIDSTWSVWSDTLSGNVRFDREGTMFKVPLGAAWQPIPWLALGATVNLESGSLRESLANYYVEPSGIGGVPFYSSNLRIDEDRYTGTSYTVGALLSPGSRLRLGASWTSAHDIEVERKVEQGGISQRQYSTFDLSLPAELTAGFAARLSQRWSLGGDARFAKFTEFAGRDDWMAEMEDEVAYAFGFERSRASVRRGGWSNLPVRLGASWQRWAYQIGGEPVTEKTLSLGTGFAFRSGAGQLDLALSYALVGDRETNGLESGIWRLAVSVTGLEAWW